MVKGWIAAYFRREAEWRDLKAEEYPEDRRNARCAAGLRALADYVEALPADDERLLMLDARGAEKFEAGTGSWAPGEEGRRLGARFRFTDPDEDPASFFTWFCEHVERDISGEIRQGNWPEE